MKSLAIIFGYGFGIVATFFCLLPWLSLAQVPTMPGGAVPWYRQNSGDGDTNVPSLLWWKANDGSGTHITGDASGGGDDGTTADGWVVGESGLGYALDFTGGVSGKASTDAAIQFNTNALTVTFWLNVDTVVSNQTICGTWDTISAVATKPKWGISVGSSKLHCALVGDLQSSAKTIPYPASVAGGWVHVAVAFESKSVSEGGIVNFWTNAVSVATSTETDTMDTGGGTFSNTVVRVGGFTNAAGSALKGSVDDVRIFPGLLTAPSITNIYLHPK